MRSHPKEATDKLAAEESIAPRFTRQMCAVTSRYGVLTDPPVVFVVEAVVVVTLGGLWQADLVEVTRTALYAIAGAPLAVAVVTYLSLLGARRKVLDWLTALPFPIDNMNALLNGVGQNLVVSFESAPPERAALNDRLERVHDDCFALEYADEYAEVEVRIGVLDSKYNPAGAAHRRFERVKRIVDGALVPLSREHAITRVRVC